MNKGKKITNVFYLDEHVSCKNYITPLTDGFKMVKLSCDESLLISERVAFHLVFLLKGSISVSSGEQLISVLHKKEMCFLNKVTKSECMASVDSEIVIFTFEVLPSVCDKLHFESLSGFAKNMDYEFSAEVIRKPILFFLYALKGCLNDGFGCGHFQEIKIMELFLLIRAYYSKEEVTKLFYPIIGKSIDFKMRVFENFMEVKNVKELAAICLYSEKVFYRLFVEEFGQPPGQWMLGQKAVFIKNRLCQREIPIKEIVDEFRFSSPSHFNRFCLNQFGRTPARLRHDLLDGNSM